jgi:periplasmic protein TonB
MSTLTFGHGDFGGAARAAQRRSLGRPDARPAPRGDPAIPAVQIKLPLRADPARLDWRLSGGVVLLAIVLHGGLAWQLSHRHAAAAPRVTPPIQLSIEVTPPKPLPETITPPKPLPQKAQPPAKPRTDPVRHVAAARPTPAPTPVAAPVTPAATSADAVQVAPPPAVAAPAPVAEPVTEASGDADYLHNPAPVYPSVAQDQGWEGHVVLKVHVLASGHPDSVSISASSGRKMLDEAALKAVTNWTFVPARRGTTSIDGWVSVPIDFKLG